jgi:oligosaccharide repeat unit polymerase
MKPRLKPFHKAMLATIGVTAVMALSPSLTLDLVLIGVFVIAAMKQVRFEITHPVVWLPPFIYIYHFNIVILFLTGYEHVEHPAMIVWIGWICIAVSELMFLGLCRPNAERRPGSGQRPLDLSLTTISLGYSVMLLWLLKMCATYFGSGFENKIDFYVTGSLPGLDYVPMWLLMFYGFWMVKRQDAGGSFHWPLFLFTGGVTLFATLALGERDIFLNFCAVSMFLVYHYYKPGKLVLYGAGVVVVGPLISILHNLRNIFSRDLSDVSAFGEQGMVLSFLYGEFIAAGRNIDILLSNQQWWSYFHGHTLMWVMEHKFFPGIMVETRNSLIWFHQLFLPDWETMVGGYGFTLAGDGYINFGMFGVALFYAIMAALVVWLYNGRTRSGLRLILYAITAPLFIFATRATLFYFPGEAMLILKPLVAAYIVDRVIRLAPPAGSPRRGLKWPYISPLRTLKT